jgi:type III secretion system HrpB4-like protein
MNAPAAFSFTRAASALAAYERNAQAVTGWVHPSWLQVAMRCGDHVLDELCGAWPNARRVHADACSRALLSLLGVEVPPLSTFVAAGVPMLDVLPVELGRRVLRMRALLFRAADVRRLIDKAGRTRLAEWIGVPLDQLASSVTGTPDVARLVRSRTMLSLDVVDAETLEQEGYALIVRDECDACGVLTPCPLLRLALSRDMDLPAWFDASTRSADAHGTRTLIARLPEWLPEWAWLFG